MSRGQHRDLWETKLTLDTDTEEEEIYYRYCVVFVLPAVFPCSGVRVVVRRWESHLNPRRLRLDVQEEEYFGQNEGVFRTQRGWLTDEVMVQFKIHGGGIDLWRKKEADCRVFAKVTSLARREGEGEESLDLADLRDWAGKNCWPLVETAALTEEGCTRKVQQKYGVEYTKDEDSFIQFEIQLLNPSASSFLVDIFTKPDNSLDDDSTEAKHVGMCFIYPENFKQTFGRLQVPITSLKFQPIGSLTVDYLVIRPLQEVEMDFSVTYRNYWDKEWSGLDVGHRGLGNSYTLGGHCSHIKENTMASMKDAILHGADMVEFDVMVSKDLVPIVHHEFSVCVVTKTKLNGEVMIDVPVKDLSLAELQGLRSHHPTEKERGVKCFGENEGKLEHEPFPTLHNVLVGLDYSCGANIEVKYGQTFKGGTNETESQMEMNLFLDQILKTVLREAGDRKIVFSSFSPDVCTMLSFKQNRYPILLLTQGNSEKYELYRDPRTWSIKAGTQYAEMAGLCGLSAMAELLIRDPGQMDLVRKRGQVIFIWTDEQNDRETVKYLKKLGVDGVIYDRMDQNNEKIIKESVFLAEKRKISSIAESAGSSSTSPKSSPGASPQHSRSLSFSGLLDPS